MKISRIQGLQCPDKLLKISIKSPLPLLFVVGKFNSLSIPSTWYFCESSLYPCLFFFQPPCGSAWAPAEASSAAWKWAAARSGAPAATWAASSSATPWAPRATDTTTPWCTAPDTSRTGRPLVSMMFPVFATAAGLWMEYRTNCVLCIVDVWMEVL